MKNELFSIGPFTVYGYGLMIALGVIAAYLVGEYSDDCDLGSAGRVSGFQAFVYPDPVG